MLHFDAVDTRTLELLRAIQAHPLFAKTRLVGGTALALQYGHRKSIDLDFFGSVESSFEEISLVLQEYGTVEIVKNSRAVKVFLVDRIKVDFVDFAYPWIDETKEDAGVRVASDKDIAAMKVAAISGRGSKKDFWDLYFLLNRYSLEQILEFYQAKYYDGSIFLALKSLVYFNDAEKENDPESLILVSWSEVQKRIIGKHREYLEKL